MTEKAVQSKPPTLPSTHTSQPDHADKKRKQDQKGNEVIEERKTTSTKEAEVQRGGKQAKITQTRSASEGVVIDGRGDRQVEVPAWNPLMVLDGAPFPSDSSIRDFQHGRAGYVANAVKQALLLPVNMADLRGMRNYEVFIRLKRDLALVSFSTNFLTPKVITMSSFFSPFHLFFLTCYSFPW